MNTTDSLPHWQLQSIFPGIESEAYRSARSDLREAVEDFASFLEEHEIEDGPPLAADGVGDVLEKLLRRLDHLYTLHGDVNAFLYGFISTNAFDDEARTEESSLKPLQSRMSSLAKRATAWLGRLDLEGMAVASALAREHSYWLGREIVDASHLMSGAEEDLASSLVQTGGNAWSQLHGDLISRGSIRAEIGGRDREWTVSELKNLQRDAERGVRRAAYRAELELLERNDVAYAAAMNSIKGEVAELDARRGWNHTLEASLFDKAITGASLEAMQTACRERFPVFRRYLAAKAALLGIDRLAWYDLMAPIAQGGGRTFTWDEAKAFVIEQFGRYTGELAAYAEEAFASGWIDVPPRKGKRSGAFCMPVPGRKESRILLNWGGTLDDVFTLAHELGHGYHNHCHYRAGRTILQKSTPSTLAETASIFCETIVTNAMLDRASDAERLAILEQDLLSATQLVVDIDSRFRFEKTVLDKRPERELSIDEMKGIMLDAQAVTYGDALHATERHPYMWAQKPHYYSAHSSFYNYPYTFGYLLGLGLFGAYRQSPGSFPTRYDAFLSSTGMADAKALAADFGIDIEDTGFWRSGLDIVETRVEAFEELAGELR